MKCPRLIEVALPIREISAEGVRQKKAQRGHISTLHCWWARRPIATSRAIVFASLVPDPDDPSCSATFREAVRRLLKDEVPNTLKSYLRGRKHCEDPDPYRPYEGIDDSLRNRLVTFIAKFSPEWIAFEKGKHATQPKPPEMLDGRCLVKWETAAPDNKQGADILRIARELVRVAYSETAPVFLDPFAGGGSIPLEAARLGCVTHASDYNPVAYLILKATCQYPQQYGIPGVRPTYGHLHMDLAVPNGLAHDVQVWVERVSEQACSRIGHLYPPGKDKVPVAGYFWARTIPCSNPACRAEIPLIRNLLVSTKPGKRAALVMKKRDKEVTFHVVTGDRATDAEGTMLKLGDCRCPICQQIKPVEDLRREALDGKMGERMAAVILNTTNGRGYRSVEQVDLDSFAEAVRLAQAVELPREYIVPEINAPNAPSDAGAHRSISVDIYGFKTFGSLFNPRQLVAMQTLVRCLHDALTQIEKTVPDPEYRKSLAAYLGLWISRVSARYCSLTVWNKTEQKYEHAFGRQAIPMTWDYPEANPFIDGSGGLLDGWDLIRRVIVRESCSRIPARVTIGDAAGLDLASRSVDCVVTDPPYFDAIAYADLSDYFYVWLKRGIGHVFPEAFRTPQTPKKDEAVAHKHRHHGNREKGKEHFQMKLAACFAEANRICKSDGVIAVMFAHQSTEAWTALINSLFEANLTITATYPIDTEMTDALKRNVSALESSITVVCRPRKAGVASSFREVRKEIDRVVQASVHRFWGYGFRGADLIVACYGPAVGVFGKHERVEKGDGTLVGVPALLELVRESALKAIAGEFTSDVLSRLYFVWANLYGTSEQAWDDARMVVQIGAASEDATEVARGRGLLVVDGSKCRLALLRDRTIRRHLGDENDSPLIDQLHQAMRLWKNEDRAGLVMYLRDHELADHVPFWKLAQALFEVLPHSEEDWKLVSALLGERETLRLETRKKGQATPPDQGRLFE